MTTISRINEKDFAVVTDKALSDGSLQSDFCMRFVGTVLRSHESPGHIRVGGTMRIILGPKSYARVLALAIGESVQL
jgi:hypothetical protein